MINFVLNLIVLEITSNSIASPFWYHGPSQSHEHTQLGSGMEVQSSESSVFWSLRQKEINSSPMNTHSSSRVRMEGIWPASPPLNVSPNFFSDPRNNKAGGATQPSISGYTPVLSKPNDNGPRNDQAENGKKSESSIDYWLFGVNLTKNSKTVLPPPSETEMGSPTTIPSGPKESNPSAAACETEKGQSPNNNTVSQKEQKQIDASPNERQSKQASVLSLRTRTKVHVQLSVISL